MKLIDSKFASLIEGVCVAKFGVVYFFKEFIVTEVNEGEIFGILSSEELIELAYNHYGTKANLHIISNRINNYSVVPTHWVDFYKTKNENVIKSVSFVNYNELAYSNAKLEQTFIKCKTECFSNLQDAINKFSNITDKRTA